MGKTPSAKIAFLPEETDFPVPALAVNHRDILHEGLRSCLFNRPLDPSSQRDLGQPFARKRAFAYVLSTVGYGPFASMVVLGGLKAKRTLT
jgi:hypothetical protein